MANILVLFRVVLLWDKDRTVLRLLIATFVLSFTATFSTMLVMITILAPSMEWSSIAKMCITTRTSPVLIAVWASPMGFEIIVLVLTTYNAFARPRAAQVHLAKTLHRDGALFFLALLILRVINIIFAATANPGKTMFAVFFVWAMVTLTLNRLLLHIRAAEVAEAAALTEVPQSALLPTGHDSNMIFSLSGRASPFALGVVQDEYQGERWEMKNIG
ncbi:hypothetical protein EW146_g5580 [Bondarzewia mesenterica]|uniref:G-protein coupled receptors family 1 profile domain-containing protein n=1 Tax=Bondarzewia mesenterica TaxID=1095465 RepID=A0A4S4LT50_9AGAM|nr:hypothetical protein EW146_g5580 [Bondarzewia mesenterica]